MLLDAHGVVAAAIEASAVNAAEVADAGQCNGHQTVEKFVHTVAA